MHLKKFNKSDHAEKFCFIFCLDFSSGTTLDNASGRGRPKVSKSMPKKEPGDQPLTNFFQRTRRQRLRRHIAQAAIDGVGADMEQAPRFSHFG